MDPQEMMLFLSIVPDEVLIRYAQEEAGFYAEAFAGSDRDVQSADILLSQMIHAALIWRGLDVDALDFFSRINAVHPVLDGMPYSEYVEFVRANAPH